MNMIILSCLNLLDPEIEKNPDCKGILDNGLHNIAVKWKHSCIFTQYKFLLLK